MAIEGFEIIREFQKRIVRPFEDVIDDKKRAVALKKPSYWLQVGITICAFNAILILLMTPLPYMQSTIVVGWRTISSSGPSNMFLALGGYIINGFVLYILKHSLDQMKPPSNGDMESDERGSKIERSRNMIRKMAQDIRISIPKFIVRKSKRKPPIETYMPTTSRSWIVMNYDVLKALEDNEMQAVLAHETHHIKFDVPYFVYKNLFDEERMFMIFPFFLTFLIILIEGVTLLLLFPLTVLDVYFPIAFELFWVFLILHLLGIILASLYALQSIEIVNFVFFQDIFQYETDSYAALTTGETFALATALVKADALGKMDSKTAISVIKGYYTTESISRLRKELHPSIFSKPELITRVRVLLLMDALLFGNVSFEFKRQLRVEFMGLKDLHLYTNPFESRVRETKKQELKDLLQLLSSIQKEANLRSLRNLPAEALERLLALFLFLLVNDYIVLTNINPPRT